jgi:hypothetical protein
MKGLKSFELQLLVISILIPVYLNILPSFIKPIIYLNLTLDIAKIVSYSVGLIWFVCLTFGTYSLIHSDDFLKERSLKYYKWLYTLNNRITVIVLVFLITVYLTLIVTNFLFPLYSIYPTIAIPFSIFIIILLIGIIIFIKMRGGKLNVQKKE